MIKSERLGLYFPDGALLSNAAADFACKPDATFVSAAGLQDRVRLLEGREGGYVESLNRPLRQTAAATLVPRRSLLLSAATAAELARSLAA
jgi:hypothetical protein